MKWNILYSTDAEKDFDSLDRSQQLFVLTALDKVSENPLPSSEGGYGKPLGHTSGYNLTGLLKIKLKKSGIRIVYQLIRIKEKMIILVIGARADNEVYKIAGKRINKKGN